jgi:hypothetical protein
MGLNIRKLANNMTRIRQIHVFTKNKDKTSAVLINFVAKTFDLRPAYATTFVSQHKQSGVLASKDGYIFVHDDILMGLNNLD